MSNLLAILRSRRLVMVSVFFAVFAQLAIVTHSVLEEHEVGEPCELCVASDKTDKATLPVVAVLAPAAPFSQVWREQFSQPASVQVTAVRNRGPPLL